MMPGTPGAIATCNLIDLSGSNAQPNAPGPLAWGLLHGRRPHSPSRCRPNAPFASAHYPHGHACSAPCCFCRAHTAHGARGRVVSRTPPPATPTHGAFHRIAGAGFIRRAIGPHPKYSYSQSRDLAMPPESFQYTLNLLCFNLLFH